MQYLPLYFPQQALRHNMKPSFIGLAQINVCNVLSWEVKFCFGIGYLDQQSFCLDMRLVLITIWKVIRWEGISAAGESTMTPFTHRATASEAR